MAWQSPEQGWINMHPPTHKSIITSADGCRELKVLLLVQTPNIVCLITCYDTLAVEGGEGALPDPPNVACHSVITHPFNGNKNCKSSNHMCNLISQSLI